MAIPCRRLSFFPIQWIFPLKKNHTNDGIIHAQRNDQSMRWQPESFNFASFSLIILRLMSSAFGSRAFSQAFNFSLNGHRTHLLRLLVLCKVSLSYSYSLLAISLGSAFSESIAVFCRKRKLKRTPSRLRARLGRHSPVKWAANHKGQILT